MIKNAEAKVSTGTRRPNQIRHISGVNHAPRETIQNSGWKSAECGLADQDFAIPTAFFAFSTTARSLPTRKYTTLSDRQTIIGCGDLASPIW